MTRPSVALGLKLPYNFSLWVEANHATSFITSTLSANAPVGAVSILNGRSSRNPTLKNQSCLNTQLSWLWRRSKLSQKADNPSSQEN